MKNKDLPSKYYIASVSWGKDSLAMLLLLIDKGYPLDEVVFYDTGMEFQAIYDTQNRMKPTLEQLGIKYTVLYPENSFLYDMLERPKIKRSGVTVYGDGWCGGPCRWGTFKKLRALDKYAKEHNAVVYIGLAADERVRLLKLETSKRAPLAELGVYEKAALALCYERGFFWEESGVRLYDILDRVSCWCCCNKNLRELRNMYKYLPEYWDRLKNLQLKIDRPMKGWYNGQPRGVFELEQRFKNETLK